jgi:methionine aminopeptidase
MTGGMARRRKRFVVTRQHTDGRSTVAEVLAYPDKSGAAPSFLYSHFTESGWSVVSIIPKTEYKRNKQGGWQVSQTVYNAEIKKLSLPVVLKQTGHKGGRWGAHQLRTVAQATKGLRKQVSGGPLPVYHHITIKSWLTPKEAGEAIYHELDHALYAEQEMSKFWNKYYVRYKRPPNAEELRKAWHTSPARSRKVSYDKRPCEVRARLAERTNDIRPIAVDTKIIIP